MRPATYIDGIYPLIGRPLHPELWHGCVGAWAPCLGPTGLTLRDWSGYGNHGAITNATLSTFWLQSAGRYAIDPDASNDFVDVGAASAHRFLDGDFAISMWVLRKNATAGILLGKDVAGARQWTVYLNLSESGSALTGTITFIDQSGAGLGTWFGAESAAVPLQQWTHVALCRNSGTGLCYVNGVLVRSRTLSSNVNYSATSKIYIGGREFAGNLTPAAATIDDVRMYAANVSANTIRLLASRRGVAYELAPRRRVSVVAGFNRRRRLLVGASS